MAAAAGVDGQGTTVGEYRLSGPYTHENLTIFLIHGQDKLKGKAYLTLQEALEQKKAIVHETGSVNELAIQNVSDEDVYVQSGDIVKGGRQDRTIAYDFIIPPHSAKVPIASFCVEAGRWQARGSEAAVHFESSNNSLASKELKMAAKVAPSQQEVWRQVGNMQQSMSANAGVPVEAAASPSSLQLSLENSRVQELTDAYIKALQPVLDSSDDAIGYAFAINGQMNSADVYASSALFRKLWPKLLRASANEAFAKLQKGQAFAPVSVDTVRACIVEAEQGREERKDLTPRVQMITRQAPASVLFETRDRQQDGQWVHRNYLTQDPVARSQPEQPRPLQQGNAPAQQR